MPGSPSENVHFVNVEQLDDDDDDENENEPDEDAAPSVDAAAAADDEASPPKPLFEVREPVDALGGGVEAAPSSLFVIPELPRGRELVLNILSTWGDPYYVGLMGLEVFDGAGHLVAGPEVWADPPDINVLPDNRAAPRGWLWV